MQQIQCSRECILFVVLRLYFILINQYYQLFCNNYNQVTNASMPDLLNTASIISSLPLVLNWQSNPIAISAEYEVKSLVIIMLLRHLTKFYKVPLHSSYAFPAFTNTFIQKIMCVMQVRYLPYIHYVEVLIPLNDIKNTDDIKSRYAELDDHSHASLYELNTNNNTNTNEVPHRLCLRLCYCCCCWIRRRTSESLM